MEFLPLICFSPFIIYKLKFSNKKYYLTFFLGLLLGFIPSLINISLAFMKYGDQGYLRLLSFFSQKVLEEEDPLEGFCSIKKYSFIKFTGDSIYFNGVVQFLN